MQGTAARRAVLIATVLLAVCVPCVCAQSSPDELERALKGKRVALRSFSADQVVQYRWVNGSLAFDPPHVSTLAVFAAISVDLKQGVVIIKGTRSTLILDEDKLALSGTALTSLRIDLGQANPAVVLPQLASALFFPEMKSMLAAVPAQVAEFLPFQTNASKRPKNRPMWYMDGGTWKTISVESKSYQEPKMLHMGNLTYPAQGKQAGVGGTLALALTIGDNGKIQSLWLVNPLGMGFDESAEDSAWQDEFSPAKVDGHPVVSQILSMVSFQMQCNNCVSPTPSSPFPNP